MVKRTVKKPKTHSEYGLLLVVVLAAGAFFLGQLATSGARDVGAGIEDEIQYGDTVERLFIADDEKPKLRGELNGIEFVESSEKPKPREKSPKCENAEITQVWGTAVSSLKFDFDVKYLPSRATLDFAVASMCDDDVIPIQKAYTLDKGGFISVERHAGPAKFGTSAAADRMKVRTVGKRPAVVSHPVVPMDRAEIFLRDGGGNFRISSMNLSLDELLLVAEGIKTR